MASSENLQTIRRDQDIDGWRVRIYFWSRDIQLLSVIALLIFALAGGLGWFLRNPKPQQNLAPNGGKPQVSLHQELKKEEPDPVLIFEAIAAETFTLEGEVATGTPEKWITDSKLTTDGKQIAIAYLNSVTAADGLPSADLFFYSHWVKPFRFANELVGDLRFRSGSVHKARKYYEREIQLHDAATARKKLIEMYSGLRDFDTLGPLAKDPAYREHLSLHMTILLAAHERRWGDIIKPLGAYEMTMWKPVPVILAIVAGVVWMAIALQAIQPHSWFGFRTVVPFIAVLAGMLSTWPTSFAGIWEERVWELRETGEFLPDLLYYVVGVGPREELIKLLFFLPFLPFLLRRGSRLEMLMVAGCVGLGFAIEKNLQYFEHAGPAAAFGRFLTANFFHLAATGVIGLALCDALRAPRRKFLPFVATLFCVTLAHGFYDAFLGVAGLQVLSIFSMIAYLLLALYFFRQLRTLRDGATDQLSIAATLVVGLAVVVAVMFVLAARLLGYELAGTALAINGPGLIMVYYIFYWQFGEGMSSVEQTPEEAAFNGSRHPAFNS
ncbi:MAG: PrsW family intramembrane metalloprotease [Verrucomicrobiaceae bacterium]|nr:MAG: PrsW family intramembrane metalloprotease [Verrucomicrobiaceae bacterium]